MRGQHSHRATAQDQPVLASASGQQHQRQGGPQAHQAPRPHQPDLPADDLRRSDDPGLTFQEDAPVPVRIHGVGDHLHVGERLLQGTHDCPGKVSLSISTC